MVSATPDQAGRVAVNGDENTAACPARPVSAASPSNGADDADPPSAGGANQECRARHRRTDAVTEFSNAADRIAISPGYLPVAAAAEGRGQRCLTCSASAPPGSNSRRRAPPTAPDVGHPGLPSVSVPVLSSMTR